MEIENFIKKIESLENKEISTTDIHPFNKEMKNLSERIQSTPMDAKVDAYVEELRRYGKSEILSDEEVKKFENKVLDSFLEEELRKILD